MPEIVKVRFGLYQVMSMNLDVLPNIALNLCIAIFRRNIRGCATVKLVKDALSYEQCDSRAFEARCALKQVDVHKTTAGNIEPFVAASNFRKGAFAHA